MNVCCVTLSSNICRSTLDICYRYLLNALVVRLSFSRVFLFLLNYVICFHKEHSCALCTDLWNILYSQVVALKVINELTPCCGIFQIGAEDCYYLFDKQIVGCMSNYVCL